LRGTALDPFGYTQERRLERKWIADFRGLVLDELLPYLSADNLADAVKVAEAAQAIKGFGHVKLGNIALAETRQSAALASFRAPRAEFKTAARILGGHTGALAL